VLVLVYATMQWQSNSAQLQNCMDLCANVSQVCTRLLQPPARPSQMPSPQPLSQAMQLEHSHTQAVHVTHQYEISLLDTSSVQSFMINLGSVTQP
jgi:hypothetical protein